MTPEEATSYLDTATENGLRAELNLPYMLDGKDMQDALETIAGMEYEYGVQQRGEFIPLLSGDAIEMAQTSGHRVMCRLVGKPEEL